MKSLDVYGIGNAIMDLQVEVDDSVLEKFSLVKGGMQLVEVEKQKEIIDYLHGKNVYQSSGGSAANTIISIAQLGGAAGYGCCVGDDEYGASYSDEMQSLGVLLHNDPVAGSPTGTSVILITPDAERTLNTNLGASQYFGSTHISEDMIAKAKWLYIEGYLFSSEYGQQAAKAALACAKKNDTKVAVTCSDGFIVEVFHQQFDEVAREADLIFANIVEAQSYTKTSTEAEGLKALKDIVPNVVMTRSERGAVVSIAGEDVDISGREIVAKDATGAGDMFAGGFLYALSQDGGAKEAGELANLLASKVVEQLGARLQCDVRQLSKDSGFLPAQI